MEEGEAGKKQVVSKGRYVVNIGGKAALGGFGGCVFGFGVVGLLCCLFAPSLIRWNIAEGASPIVAFVGIVGGGSVCLLCISRQMMKEAKETDAGVPLTRANTGHLPAQASLVRPASEPTEAQQTTLLRAATEKDAAPAEQLLRATTGQNKTL